MARALDETQKVSEGLRAELLVLRAEILEKVRSELEPRGKETVLYDTRKEAEDLRAEFHGTRVEITEKLQFESEIRGLVTALEDEVGKLHERFRKLRQDMPVGPGELWPGRRLTSS